MNETYKEQLITQETVSRKRLKELTMEKDSEIVQMKVKIKEMEKEIKDLLDESAKERKIMEEKFLRMSKTFHELQKELS